MKEYKLIRVTKEFYNVLVKKTKGKESFEKTITRLIKNGPRKN